MPRMKTVLLPALWLCLGLTTAGHAAVMIPIVNPGFETETTPMGTFSVTTLTGWTLHDPNGIEDGSSDAIGVLHPAGTDFFPAGAPEGDNVALIFLAGDIGGGEVGITQSLADTLQPNTRYTLTVEVGNIASGTGLPPGNTDFFDLDGFPGYAVQFLAGGVVIQQDDNSLFGAIAEGEFETSTVQIDIGAAHDQLGQPLGIRLINLNVAETVDDPGIEVDFDNVQLTSGEVPEPASLIMLCTATAIAGSARRPRPQR